MREWLLLFLVAGMLGAYSYLLLIARRMNQSRKLHFLIAPFVVLLQYRAVVERLQPLLQKQRLQLTILNNGESHRDQLLSWAAQSLGFSYLVVGLTTLLGALTMKPFLLFMGLLVACCIPLLRARELSNQVDKRRQMIVMELPELLNRLLLMVNAGDNVMHALSRCVEQKKGMASENPLYVELARSLEGMKRGESMVVALEEMGRRCAVPEVRLFATTILINARRGGESFVPVLRELTRQMWEKRKSMARMLGEQASSRLAFPLALIFLLILVLVGAPTMLMM